MPQPSPAYGAYIGVESLRNVVGITDTTHDQALLRHVTSGSRMIERETLRHFFPYTATNLYRWPSWQIQATWEVWTEEDLLSVTAITAASTGTNAQPIPITSYFLEPQWAGPPYNRVEVDLSTGNVFQSGPTPQRSISITGQWGYQSTTVPAGTVSGLSGAPTITAATCSDASLIDLGDLLLIGSEQAYVSARNGDTLTLVRGVHGTTAASHADLTAASKYVAPEDVVGCVIDHAIGTWLKDQAYWQSQAAMQSLVGAEGTPTNFVPAPAVAAKKIVIEHYRRARVAAV